MREDMRLLYKRAVSLLSADPQLTLPEIARSIGIDRHKIQRSIKGHYGFGFGGLKKRVRPKAAMALIFDEKSDHHIKEIATAVGITPNHLSRFIRSMTGHCATDLRSLK